jgi:hypothetical protein
MEISGETVEPWLRFIERVADLRAGWFQIDHDNRCHQLNDLLHEAALISTDLIEKLNGFIEAELWTHNSQENSTINAGIHLGDKIFIPQYNPDKVFEDTIAGYKRTGKWQSYLPINFFFPLVIYSAEEGHVSAHIQKSLTNVSAQFLVKDDNVPNIMQDRIRLMNKHGAFYKDNAVRISMVHSYYGYNPIPGAIKFYQAIMHPHRLIYKVLKHGRNGR